MKLHRFMTGLVLVLGTGSALAYRAHHPNVVPGPSPSVLQAMLQGQTQASYGVPRFPGETLHSSRDLTRGIELWVGEKDDKLLVVLRPWEVPASHAAHLTRPTRLGAAELEIVQLGLPSTYGFTRMGNQLVAMVPRSSVDSGLVTHTRLRAWEFGKDPGDPDLAFLELQGSVLPR